MRVLGVVIINVQLRKRPQSRQREFRNKASLSFRSGRFSSDGQAILVQNLEPSDETYRGHTPRCSLDKWSIPRA